MILKEQLYELVDRLDEEEVASAVMLLRRQFFDEGPVEPLPASVGALHTGNPDVATRSSEIAWPHSSRPTEFFLLRSVLIHLLPWARLLPEGGIDELAVRLWDAAGAVASDTQSEAPVDNTAIAQLLIKWRHTAEVYADPDLLAHVTAPIVDSGPVPVPGHPGP